MRYSVLFLTLANALTPLNSEGQTLQVTDVKRLSEEPPPFPLVESFLVVNPDDSNNLIASAMSVSGERSLVYVSRDGGATWRSGSGPNGTAFPGGDPMLAFDGTGRAYFTTITPALNVWWSEDGGEEWNGPAIVEGTYDRQWLAAQRSSDNQTPPIHGVAKTRERETGRQRDMLVTFVSLDRGRSFAERATIPLDSGFLQVAADLVVARNGTMFLPFFVNYGAVAGGRALLRGRRWLITSTDAGLTWSEPSFISENFSYGNANRDQAMKGLGGGDLYLDETEERFDGSVYTVWPTSMDNRLQIVFAYSRDRGQTWSAAKRINSAGFSSNHSTPMVVVDSDGRVIVTWNDRRNDPDDECFQLFASVSNDGGESFGENRAISDMTTCPGAGSRWLNGGETQGLVPLPGGRFRVTWSVGTRENLAVWTAVVRID